jgi:hypothetical protein
MTDQTKHFAGGCLCGALRYDAVGEPIHQGLCFCGDCRKASGSGFIGFLGFRADAVRFSGTPRQSVSTSIRGSDATRNFCPVCGGLVFGGVVGKTASYTIYAGSLDDPSLFHPTIAIFGASRPAWVPMPPGLKVFDRMPG